jgi:hypothetical protein
VSTYFVQGEGYRFNKVQRTASIRVIWQAYQSYQKSIALNVVTPGTSFKPGRDTLRQLLKYVTAPCRSKACLSFYYVRLVDTFVLYERLITECAQDQRHAIQCFDELHTCTTHQAQIRSALVPAEAYTDKILEYKAILKFVTYELKNHLCLEHDGCHGVGLHCIQHGLFGCDDKLDHSKHCTDCYKFLRSAHDLRQWLRNRHNDLCRAFELILPEWRARGSSLRDVQIVNAPVSPSSTVDPVATLSNVVSVEECDIQVQCEQCMHGVCTTGT